MTPPPRRDADAVPDDDGPAYDGGNTTGFVSPAGDALEGVVDLAAVLDLRRPHRRPRVMRLDRPTRGMSS